MAGHGAHRTGVSDARERNYPDCPGKLSKLTGMARNSLGVVPDVSAQPVCRHRLGLGAKTSPEVWNSGPKAGKEMERSVAVRVSG